jgi:hypothetical protein
VRLEDLPTFEKNKGHHVVQAGSNKKKYYMVTPFVKPLRKWVEEQHRLDINKARKIISDQSISMRDHGVAQTIPLEHLSLDHSYHPSANGPLLPIHQLPYQALQGHSDIPKQDNHATEEVKRLLWSQGPIQTNLHLPGSENTPYIPPVDLPLFQAMPGVPSFNSFAPPNGPLNHLPHPLPFFPPHFPFNAGMAPPYQPPFIPHPAGPSHAELPAFVPPPFHQESPPKQNIINPPPSPPSQRPSQAPKTAHHATLVDLLRGSGLQKVEPPVKAASHETATGLVDSLLKKDSGSLENLSLESKEAIPVASQPQTASSAWGDDELQKKLLATLKGLIPS